MKKHHAPDPESRELSRFFAELDRAEAAELTREIAGKTPAEPLPPQLERRLLRTRRAAALRRGGLFSLLPPPAMATLTHVVL